MFKFKDKTLKTSFYDSGAAGSLDTNPQVLANLVKEKIWVKEDFPVVAYCADKASHLGSSQGTPGGSDLRKRDPSLFKKCDKKGHYVQDCIRANFLQQETNKPFHFKRRIMIYLCGGYQGKADRP